MRILFLTLKFPYPLKDGGAIATFQLYRGLSKHVDNVYLMSFNTSKHFVKEQQIPSEYFAKYAFKLVNINTTPGIASALFNLVFSNKPYILQLFKSSLFQKELIRLLNSAEFDLVQIEGLYMLQYISDIRKNSNAKIAFRAHNIEHQIWGQLAQKCSWGLKKYYYKLLSCRIFRYEKAMLNSYDMIVPISPEDASVYQNYGNTKPLKVIPTGFDFNNIKRPGVETNEHCLFFIGSLEWRPNQEGLLWFIDNCWQRISKILPKIEFHIAGRNTPQWLIDKFSVKGIVWCGEVEKAEVFMNDKSIMLVPLQSGSGMRVKIIEAFTQSKAVVATSTAARGTGAIDGEHMLIADHHEAFVYKILQLIENRELYDKLTQNAYAHAKKNFNNEQISLDLFQFYNANLR